MFERIDTTFVAISCCGDVSVMVFGDRILCVCPNHPPMIIESNGKSYTLKPGEKMFMSNKDKQ